MSFSWFFSCLLVFLKINNGCTIHHRDRVCSCYKLLLPNSLDNAYYERLWRDLQECFASLRGNLVFVIPMAWFEGEIVFTLYILYLIFVALHLIHIYLIYLCFTYYTSLYLVDYACMSPFISFETCFMTWWMILILSNLSWRSEILCQMFSS
jgi:hypothetical protein